MEQRAPASRPQVFMLGVAIMGTIACGDGELPADESLSASAVDGSATQALETANGMRMQNGWSVRNGLAVRNGYRMNNGTTLANGFTVKNGVDLSNGITLRNGVLAENGVNLRNGITMQNGYRLPNGVTLRNGVPASTGFIAPVPGTDMDEWIGADPGNGLMTLKYMIQCALTPNDQVYVQFRDTGYWYNGLVGLAPGWRNGAMTPAEMERVSACMLARVNESGKHVRIELRGPHAALDEGLALEAAPLCTNYQVGPEAVFFGNIYSDQPVAYMCRAQMADFYGGTRACGKDCSNDLVIDLGPCRDVCDFVDGPDADTAGDYYDNCRAPDGTIWAGDKVVTAWRDYCSSYTPLNKIVGGSGGTNTRWSFTVPAGAASVQVSLSGGTGNPDLYMQKDSQPTASVHQCASVSSKAGKDETCTLTALGAGTYHILAKWLTTGGNWKLKASYGSPAPEGWLQTPDFALNRECFGPGDTMIMTVFHPVSWKDWWWISSMYDRWAYTNQTTLSAQVNITAPLAEGTYPFKFYYNDAGSTNVASQTEFRVDAACATNPQVSAAGAGLSTPDFTTNKACYTPGEYMQVTIPHPGNALDWWWFPADNRWAFTDMTTPGGAIEVSVPRTPGDYWFGFYYRDAPSTAVSSHVTVPVRNTCP